MAELVIKDVDDTTLAQLAKQAEAYGRSLQDELKFILRHAAIYAAPLPTVSMNEARKMADETRAKLAGRHHTDSVELLREDRSRGSSSAWMTEVDRLQITLEQMDRLLDALEDLKQTILPTDPTHFAAMAERPLEDLGRLKSEIRECLRELKPVG